MAGKILGRCTMAVALALVGYGMIACGDDDGGSEGPDCSTNTLTYSNYGQALMNQHCIACHGATPVGSTTKLDTLAAIQAASQGIMTRAVELTEMPTMPYLLPALPEAERQKLGQWLECGAPP
jgi:mono/diheme cytochrome c family protein